MQQRLIGEREVSAVGLGGALLSLASDRDDDRFRATLEAALEAGITYLDTAAAYTTADEPAHNERIIGETLRALGDPDVVVGTKGGHFRRGNEWPIDGRPESIRRDCERSLAALGVESLDLYMLHWPDPEVPITESVGALEQLRIEGKVRRTGVSNVNAEQLRASVAESPIAVVENPFSPFRTGDRSLIDACADLGIAFLAYSPLGGARTSRAESLPRTATAASALGLKLEQAILAWELSLSPAMIVIAGATRPATATDSAAAGGLALDPTLTTAIELDLAVPNQEEQ